jgi:hypothetical protein
MNYMRQATINEEQKNEQELKIIDSLCIPLYFAVVFILSPL